MDVFGLKEGQERYETKYDLDGNEKIGIPNFLIFVDHFGVLGVAIINVAELVEREFVVGKTAVCGLNSGFVSPMFSCIGTESPTAFKAGQLHRFERFSGLVAF